MAEYTEEQLKDAARRALAVGDEAAAKRFINAARAVAAAPPARSLTGMAVDWVTGANRDPNIPNAPMAGLGLDSGKAAQMTGVLASTLSDDRMQRGLSKVEPQMTYDKDSRGNLVAVMPIRNERGEIVRQQPFYPNSPGLDSTDVLMGSGAAAIASGLSVALPALGLPSTGVIGTGLLGGTEAAIVEGVNAPLTDSAYKVSDIPFGAVAGVVGGKVADGIGSAVKWLQNTIRSSGPESIALPNGTLRPEIAQMLKQAGLDPAQVSADLTRVIRDEVRLGAEPAAAAANAAAQRLPVPVPLTKGQISGSKGQQLFEDGAASGAWGETAEAIMTNQRQKQQQALNQNLDRLIDGLAPGQAPANMGEGAAMAQDALVKQRTAAKAEVDASYAAARQNSTAAVLDRPAAIDLTDAVRGAYRENFNPTTAPIVDKLLSQMDNIIANGGDLKTLMAWRQQVSGLRKGVPSPDSAAAGEVISAFDDRIKQAADNMLLSGDEAAVKNWYDAISKNAEFASTWKSKGGILSTLTETVTRDGTRQLKVPPEAAGKLIFGMTANGLAGKTALARDLLALKSKLPPAEWNAMRQEAFFRLAAAADGATRNGQTMVSGTNFKKAWDGLRANNPSVVNSLFSKEEQALFSQFASVAARATGGAVNSSNSANAAAGMIQRLAGMFGGSKMGVFLSQVQVGRMLTNATGSAKAASAVRGGITYPRPAYGPLGAAMSGAAAGNEDVNNFMDQTARGWVGLPR